MAESSQFSFLLLLFVLSFSLDVAVSAVPPQVSLSPSPHSPVNSPSPAFDAPATSPFASPPSPALPSPASSPSPSPGSSPSPAPADSSAFSHTGVVNADETAEDNSSRGMSAGKKAGIAAGVIVGACAIGLAGVVYKKRQQNIRRSQYGYSARTELLFSILAIYIG